MVLEGTLSVNLIPLTVIGGASLVDLVAHGHWLPGKGPGRDPSGGIR